MDWHPPADVSWVVRDNRRLNLGRLRRDEHVGVERGGACDEPALDRSAMDGPMNSLALTGLCGQNNSG